MGLGGCVGSLEALWDFVKWQFAFQAKRVYSPTLAFCFSGLALGETLQGGGATVRRWESILRIH
jgi:hypothetical protein